IIKGPFTWSQKFLELELKKGSQPIINTENFQIRVYRVNDEKSHKGYGSFINGVEIKGTNEDAYEDLEKLMGVKKLFDYSKHTNLIKDLIIAATEFDKNSIILDFFAGSGTTGDAVMQLNAEDGGNRKYILVQLPETIDKKDKAAYEFVTKELKAEPTIFEITKERLLRAEKKINQELDEKNKDLEAKIKSLETELTTEETKEEIEALKEEIKVNNQVKAQNNFKVFETMPIWEDYHFEAKELNEQLQLFDEAQLTEEDLQALLITWKTY